VVIEVLHAAPLVSPAYDDGTAPEADISKPTARGSPGSTNIAPAGNRRIHILQTLAIRQEYGRLAILWRPVPGPPGA
jgi:hypothetical protein